MKKLTWLLIVALALSLTPLSLAEGTYAEAPMLTRQVEALRAGDTDGALALRGPIEEGCARITQLL